MAFEVGAALVLIGVAAGAVSSGSAQVDVASGQQTGSAPAEVSDAAAADGSSPPLALQAPEAPVTPPGPAQKPARPAGAAEPDPDEEAAGEKAEGEEKPADAEAPPAPPPPAAAEPALPESSPAADVAPAAAPPAVEPAAPVTPATAAPAPVAPVPAAPVLAAAPAPDAQGPAEPSREGALASSETVFKGGAPVGADKAGGEREQPENALPPGQIAVPGGFSLALGTQMSFGQSTFQLGSSYARDPMVSWSMSLGPSLMFSDGTRLSAGASLSQELTQANGDDDPHTFILSDIGLNLGRSLHRFEGGPQIFGSLSAQIPTSQASRVESLITSVGARLSASQPVGGVFISLGSGFRKNFHEYTHPVRDPNTGERLVTRDGLVIEEVVTGIARLGGSELAGATYFDGDSNNTSMIWSNSLSAFWPATQKLGIGISYNLSHSWTYESYALDELSGVGASAGRGRRDSHGGGIFANYQALDELAFGVGMASGGPTRTADDKRIRFPFFNLEGPESNMTTFFISATYTQSVSL